MKRLRELDAQTPLQHKARELLEAVPPLAESQARMARVRRKLDEADGARGGARKLPAFAIALLIGFFGASAFAAVRVFLESRVPAITETPAPKARSTRPLPKPADDLNAERPIEAALEAQAEDPESALPGKPRKPARARKLEKSAHEVEAIAARDSAHDSALVHRAVQALRRDRNPRLAAKLLDQDRVRNPQGPLAEEALSLRIEAALELRDPRARGFAQQYLARYPEGRYLTVARRALGAFKP